MGRSKIREVKECELFGVEVRNMEHYLVAKKQDSEFFFVTRASDGQILIDNIKKAEERFNRNGVKHWSITLGDGHSTLFSEDGFFYDHFSILEYEFVELVNISFDFYIVKQNGKYGLLQEDWGGRTIQKVVFKIDYINIEILRVNLIISYGGDAHILRLNRENKVWLYHCNACVLSDSFDEILVPSHYLKHWIVRKGNLYGLIDNFGRTIVNPKYNSIPFLCQNENLSYVDQTVDRYENREVVSLIERESEGETVFYDSSNTLKGFFCDFDTVHYKDLFYLVLMKKECNNRVVRRSLCNMFGYFYGIFDCMIFDFVEKPYEEFDLYICEKNNKYGLYDNSQQPLLPISYKSIAPLLTIRNKEVFIVNTENGTFLYNAKQNACSKIYDAIYGGFYENYIFYLDGKYGVIDEFGNILIPNTYEYCSVNKPKDAYFYNYDNTSDAYVLTDFCGRLYPMYFSGGKYYGRIDKEYDRCIRISNFSSIYVVEKNGKYGIITPWNTLAISIAYDIFYFFPNNPDYHAHKLENNNHKCACLLIAVSDNKYSLFNLVGYNCLLESCSKISFVLPKHSSNTLNVYPSIIAVRNNKFALYDKFGEQVLDFVWDSIISFGRGFLISKNNKKGYFTFYDGWIADCKYDDIEIQQDRINAKIKDSCFDLALGNYDDCNEGIIRGTRIQKDRVYYEKYSGSWAQDEMGYSDDDIDTIFDGDPDAYWNID